MAPGVMQKFLERALDTISEGVFMLSIEGTFTYFNLSAERIFGIKRSSVVGRRLQDAPWKALSEEGRPFSLEERPLWRTLFANKPLSQVEMMIERSDGTRVTISADTLPLRDSAGKKIGVVCSMRDVTERKRAEAFKDALGRVDAMLLSLDEKSMERAFAVIVDALGAKSGVLVVLEDSRWDVRIRTGFSEEIVGGDFGDSRMAASLIDGIQEPRVVDSEELGSLASTKMGIEPVGGSSLLIPLRAKGKTTGFMLINAGLMKNELSAAEVGFAGEVASAMSLALENLKLYKAAIKRSETLEIISRIGGLVTGSLKLESVLSQIVNYAVLLIDASSAAVYYLDKEREEFLHASSHGLSSALSKQAISIKDARSLGIREREPLVLDDLQKYSRIPFFAAAPKEGFAGAVVTGIYIDNVLSALLIIQDKRALRLDNSSALALSLFADDVSVALKNVERFEAEHQIASTLQRAILLLPEKLPGVEYGRLYRSATARAQVGGDFYDLFELEHNKIGIVIGDVSGKGLDAAVLTALAKSTIKAYAMENSTPSTVLAKTNEVMLASIPSSSFVTVVFAILDMETGELTYCNAGHPPPIIRRSHRPPIMLENGSPLVGALKGLEYEDRSVNLSPGDTVVLYTDGIVEIPTDGHVFNERYLVEFIGALGEEVTALELPDAICDKFMEVSGGRLLDDVALLSVRWVGRRAEQKLGRAA